MAQLRERDADLDGLADALEAREATVAVVGLGYVGLPLLIEARRAGFATIGYDVDRGRIGDLQRKHAPIEGIPEASLAMFEPASLTADDRVLSDADVVVLCLPTPLRDGSPDLTMVTAAAETAAAWMHRGSLLALESTTYPGTTEEVIAPIVERAGFRVGRDVALVYSPERIDPGHPEHGLRSAPKIVSGVTDRCRDLGVAFYSTLVDEVVTTRSPREAEMAKLLENTYRQVNIALVNELAVMAHGLGVDIWDALRAAATKPFGYQPFWPGPGVGGQCIGIDPAYLSWRADQQLGYRIGFIEQANAVNNRMPEYVANRIGEALNRHSKALRGSRVLAIGVAFKEGVSDLRSSPSLEVIRRLVERGADVAYHDPFVPRIVVGGRSLESVDPDDQTVGAADLVAILTAQPGVDVLALVERARLVFDARGVTAGLDAPGVERL